jgi:hypothetical protein
MTICVQIGYILNTLALDLGTSPQQLAITKHLPYNYCGLTISFGNFPGLCPNTKTDSMY